MKIDDLKKQTLDNLIDLLQELKKVMAKLKRFLDSDVWQTEDYANSYASGFSAYASLARIRVEAIKRLQDVLDSGWVMDEDQRKTLAEVIDSLRQEIADQEDIDRILEILMQNRNEPGGGFDESSE